jgi:ESF2/ABP1 family protein
VELSQSRSEQQEYLKNVEVARQLEKRAEKKREKGEVMELKVINNKKREMGEEVLEARKKKRTTEGQLKDVLGQIF